MKKKQKNNLKNKKFIYKKNNFFYLKNIAKKKEEKKKINNQDRYLYKNKKLKKAIFLKKPKLNEIMYPFLLNMKLISEYLKKK
jgi:hypothetical protein